MKHVPEVADLHVQLGHALADVLARRGPAVQLERRGLGVRREGAADDAVGLPLRALELDLDMALFLVVLDEGLQVLRAIEKLEIGDKTVKRS